MNKYLFIYYFDSLPNDVAKYKSKRFTYNWKEGKNVKKINNEKRTKTKTSKSKYKKIYLWKICNIISKICKTSKLGILLWSCSNDEKQFGKDHLHSKIFIEDDEPYKISTIKNNGNLYNIKVSKQVLICELNKYTYKLK